MARAPTSSGPRDELERPLAAGCPPVDAGGAGSVTHELGNARHGRREVVRSRERKGSLEREGVTLADVRHKRERPFALWGERRYGHIRAPGCAASATTSGSGWREPNSRPLAAACAKGW